MRRLSFLQTFLLISASLQITGCGSTYNCSSSPFITGQPSGQNVAVGQRAVFTIAATSIDPLSYQWLKNGVAIPGATQAQYFTPVTASVDSGSLFTASVSTASGTLTSSPASLIIDSSNSGHVRFVATTGNDLSVGTIDQPYKTIQHCASSVPEGWVCEVRSGVYRETVIPNSGITITAHDFEAVIVDGSDPITGWTRYRGSIYKANAILSEDDTNQLFVGREMMTEARWPNGNDLFNVNWAHGRSGTNTGVIVDPKLPKVDWAGAKIHLWSGSNPFGHETGTVTTSGSGRLSIEIGETGTCPYICPAAGGYYYLFGTLSALDVEREWFYDFNSHALYFMAPGGVDPTTLDVRSKKRQYAFDLRGKSGVTIRNLGIFASTIVTDESSANNTLDRINARYVSHFTTLPTALDDPSGSGFSILAVHRGDSGIVLNGMGNILQNSTIAYSAGDGVALEGNNNIVQNNLIYDIDYIGDYASGVVLDGDNNIIRYNTIHTLGRQAILFNGVTNQDIGYNNLFDSMMLSRDGAEIYACCEQIASGTRIHHNWIHDTKSLIEGSGDVLALSGVYIDNGSGGFNVDQNVLWKNQRTNLLINGDAKGGSKNTNIKDNTIPDASSEGGISITNVQDCASIVIVDNRVAVKVHTADNDSACTFSNNDSNASGATEILSSTGVGCNFSGCSSTMPPAFVAGGSVAPCPVSTVVRP